MRNFTCPHCDKAFTEKLLIETALIRSAENVKEAAGLLGMSVPTLYRRMHQLGFTIERRRSITGLIESPDDGFIR